MEQWAILFNAGLQRQDRMIRENGMKINGGNEKWNYGLQSSKMKM
jgi:hypothetical protein